MQRLQSYVYGTWHTGTGEHRPLYDPTTEEVLAECSSEGVDFGKVVNHGREVGGPALRGVGFAARAGMLKALSAAIHEHREELIDLSVRNGGNRRGDAKFDIDGATGTLAAYASFGKRLGDEAFLPDGDGVQLGRTARFWGQHVRVPRRGVAVHINAFNFPAWGMGEKMACALLAGMPVIEKPGTPSALLAWRIAQIIVESGVLPEGAFQFIAGGAGDLLDHLGAQDCVAFTGSSKTGSMLKGHRALLDRNVRMNIEADSLNAAILGPDVGSGDEVMNEFLGNVVTDMTQKAGQKCTAVRRILVPSDRLDDVVSALVDRLSAIKVGDPGNDDSGMGPLASKSQLADVRAGIERLAKVGKTACGGAGSVDGLEKGYFVAPTLIVADDPHADAVHADEVFGPCATVLPYSGEAADAVAITNRGGGGLVASVYSNDWNWSQDVVLGIAPWHGRVWIGADKTAGQAMAPGVVLPHMVHGGPGRAGGGEELGALRGLEFYTQRVALQGYQGTVGRTFGPKSEG
ncbi:MAG: 3,4-dehydroadipyl-CoA semialdehyde dehydrogenase [Planctomycetes bacterium]|nr:3,4-dehydroadipyl-CoA semialdehyde dehydrogenase [Planctomycetota bacterium]